MHRPVLQPVFHRPGLRAHLADACVLLCLGFVVACSAIITREFMARSGGPTLVALTESDPGGGPIPAAPLSVVDPLVDAGAEAEVDAAVVDADGSQLLEDTSVRWFNGRAIRPAKVVWMTVTAYSPDERSCAGSADDITASLHHVETNAHRLVAADSRLLPLGSMVSIPGYDNGQVVPVLDRGGKIKGYRLDVLFPTHEQARKWGVKRLQVVVWEYADGLGNEDWRRIRDSRPR